MHKRILIIDDEPDIRRVVQVSLETFTGWQTVLAGSGDEGLLKSKTESLDAILLDVTMPDMDGIECYQRLQFDATTQSIPVVLLTAKALPRDRQHFNEMGVAGVITKPFNPMTVWKELADILGW